MGAIAPYNFCVLCATQSEMAECLDVFGAGGIGVERLPYGDGSNRADHLFELTGRHGVKLTLLITVCGGMGHSEAALRVIQIIAKHSPSIVVFVGTAASLDPKKYQLGDVVVPIKAGYRRFEKVSERGQEDYSRLEKDSREMIFDKENLLVPITDTISLEPDAIGYLANIHSLDVNLKAGSAESIEINGVNLELRAPKLVTEVEIISCGMVVDSISYRDFLTNEVFAPILRKRAIIDMESYGFLRAINMAATQGVGHSTVGFLIRGVSDYAGRKQQTETEAEGRPMEWKSLASRNAAHVTREFLCHIASNTG